MGYREDPPASEGCLGCEYAHPPGMLCREQRTALTTARARTESKRDLGQLALKLKDLTAMPKSLKNKSTCDIISSSLDLATTLFARGPITSSYDSCRRFDSDAVLLPSGRDLVKDSLGSKRPATGSQARRSSSHRHISKYSPKFSSLFTGLCLLGLLSCTAAAPAASALPMDPQLISTPPKWINPCGMGSSEDVMPQDTYIPVVSDLVLVNQIVIQAKNALTEADKHKEEYVKKVFNGDFNEHHKSWKDVHYSWLPQIPKDLGEPVESDKLEAIKDSLNATLAETYEQLQKFAVGLEQVARDQRTNAGAFKDLFTGAEWKLRALLCEIQVFIIEREVSKREDVTRKIMPDEHRVPSDFTARNLRDWIIYRDYMNALEYVIDVFEYFATTLPSA